MVNFTNILQAAFFLEKIQTQTVREAVKTFLDKNAA